MFQFETAGWQEVRHRQQERSLSYTLNLNDSVDNNIEKHHASGCFASVHSNEVKRSVRNSSDSLRAIRTCEIVNDFHPFSGRRIVAEHSSGQRLVFDFPRQSLRIANDTNKNGKSCGVVDWVEFISCAVKEITELPDLNNRSAIIDGFFSRREVNLARSLQRPTRTARATVLRTTTTIQDRFQ